MKIPLGESFNFKLGNISAEMKLIANSRAELQGQAGVSLVAVYLHIYAVSNSTPFYMIIIAERSEG